MIAIYKPHTLQIETFANKHIMMNNNMTEIITKYLQRNRFSNFDLRAVLFDMDGVIYNSMPAHEDSWQQVMSEWNLKTEKNEFFIQEGRPAKFTIDLLFQRNLKRNATDEEIEKIYKRKTELFFQYDTGELISGIKETIKLVKSKDLTPILVTGSGQTGLWERLDGDLPGVFPPEAMITAFEVEIGKPNPEPYLMGLEKAGNLKPHQAIVLENAPLGVQSGHKANIFTIAVNTGPLIDNVLLDAGADLLMDSIDDLNDVLPKLFEIADTLKI